MREAFGDVWQMEGDAICITTNLEYRERDGVKRAIMGGGVAGEAARLCKGIDRLYAQKLLDGDHGVTFLGARNIGSKPQLLIAFPTKRLVAQQSSMELVALSALQLQRIIKLHDLKQVLLPRPGCGLGGLQWSNVRPLLDAVFDDRVIAVGYEKEAK